MVEVQVAQDVDAPPKAVWRELADIARHVEWMSEAEAIHFDGDQRTGVGTRFDCVTRVGPLRTRDRMEVTAWREDQLMAVRHLGLVAGEGRFTLRSTGSADGGRTAVEWTEQLRFPWYLGGPVTGWCARPVFRRIWQANLRRLAQLVDRVDSAEAVGERSGVDHSQALGRPGESDVERP